MMKLRAGILSTLAGLALVAAVSDRAFAQSVHDWDGLYMGVHGGGVFGEAEWDAFAPSVAIGPTNPAADTLNLDGPAGGAHLGYQRQMGNFVAGAEVSITLMDAQDKKFPAFGGEARDVFVEVNNLFTAVARLGYARDNWMVYVKGGYANAEVSSEVFDILGAFIGNPLILDDRRQHGWTAGAGVSYAIDDALIVGAEYNFVDLGKVKEADDLPLFVPVLQEVDVHLHMVFLRLTIQLGNLFGR